MNLRTGLKPKLNQNTGVILLTMGLIVFMGIYNPLIKMALPGAEKDVIALIRKALQAATVIACISALKWWPKMGLFQAVSKKSVYILAPVITISFIPLANGLKTENTNGMLIAVATAILIGIIEELEYRGLILEGLRNRGPFATIVLSSIIFGLFHFLNLVVGAAIDETIVQVIFATAFGLIFAVLRYLKEGMWPLILVHSLWDFNLGISNSDFTPLIDNIHSVGLILVVLWGIFLAIKTLKKAKTINIEDNEEK